MAQLGFQFSMNPEDVPQQPKVSQDSHRDPKEQQMGTPGHPKESQRKPKGRQREPKVRPKVAKGARRQPKGPTI
jgi:hypothetical protein